MRDSIHVFDKEVQTLEHARSVLQKTPQEVEALTQEFEALSDDYEKLLDDAQVITKISDRLQNRLNKANEELTQSHKEIKRKNELLQNTIDELTKAKISKKATTIVFTAAILLFVVSEVFLEPIVDSFIKQNYINVAIKGSIALLLKPIDYLVEWYLLRDAMRKAKKQPLKLTAE